MITESELYSELPTATPDEFLPSIAHWLTLGGWVLLGVFTSMIGMASILPYKNTVKASITIRPEGERRIVEATIRGAVTEIVAKENNGVEVGDAIAFLTDPALTIELQTLLAELDQSDQQIAQIQNQMLALDAQAEAETRAAERSVAASKARLESAQQTYADQQITTQADVQEAEANVRFAQEELSRYQQLQNTGIISALQLSEKEAALETQTARLERAKALINPSQSAVAQAREEMAQAEAIGVSTLAQLTQEKEQLSRQKSELQNQRQTIQQSLKQVKLEQEKLTIRAPIDGIIQELTPRNAGQILEPGEIVAQIIPKQAPLVIKAQVSQSVINQVNLGQEAAIRLDSCVYTDYGILKGNVNAISPDAISQNAAATEMAYFEVDIVPQTMKLNRGLKSCLLQAGMQGKADIVTQEETILMSWLRNFRLIAEF